MDDPQENLDPEVMVDSYMIASLRMLQDLDKIKDVIGDTHREEDGMCHTDCCHCLECVCQVYKQAVILVTKTAVFAEMLPMTDDVSQEFRARCDLTIGLITYLYQSKKVADREMKSRGWDLKHIL